MPTKTPIPQRPGIHDKNNFNKAMSQKAAINSKPIAKVKTSVQRMGKK